LQTNSLTARFDVTTLDSIWLPAAYRPVRYTGPGKVSFSADAGSLIADKATSDGLTYSVVSAVPAPDVASLRASPPVDPNDPALARYLALPTGANEVPSIVATIARQVTAGATTPYDEARHLQDYFRSDQFTYDLSVPAFDGTNAIVQFLNEKRGFCQQFAATYAVMARLLGLPARIAVGFTPGDLASDGKLHVRNADAHSWPEVYFTGIGWVAFEPTPGRGAPGAQSYTGVTPQQAPLNGSGPPAASTSPPTTTLTRPGVAASAQASSFAVAAPSSVTSGKGFKITVTAKEANGATDTKYAGVVTLGSADAQAVIPGNAHALVGGVHTFTGVRLKALGNQSITASAGTISGIANITVRRASRSLLGLLEEILLWCIPLLLLLLTPLVRRVRRSRRRATATTAEARILLAWTEVGEQLTLAGAPPRRADTPTEYAERAVISADLHGEAASALAGLAERVVEVSYAPSAAAPGAVGEAERSRKTITAAVKVGRSRWQRAVSALDPRSLVESDRR
jgi:transglutaminase-like putative cysteine protease